MQTYEMSAFSWVPLGGSVSFGSRGKGLEVGGLVLGREGWREDKAVWGVVGFGWKEPFRQGPLWVLQVESIERGGGAGKSTLRGGGEFFLI